MTLLIAEVVIMAVLVVFGLRMGGAMGVGLMSVVGVLIMVFIFKVPPGNIPVTPVMIILSIGIAGGLLEASGGIDFLVHFAGKAIQRFPGAITFVAPLIVFVFVFGIGTANIALSLEPVISRTALRAKVRPERPLIAAVTTANMALVCSPAASSAVTAVLYMSGRGLTMGKYLAIALPSALTAMVVLSVFLSFWGKPLDKDPEYQRRLAGGKINMDDVNVPTAKPKFSRKQIGAVVAFLFAVACISILGIVEPAIPALTSPVVGPGGKKTYLASTAVVQIFMYLAAAAILLITKVTPKKLYGTQIMPSAINAAVAVLGPGWLGATIFESAANARLLKAAIGPAIGRGHWIAAVLCAVVATFVMSQTAVISIIYPLALGLGVPVGFMA
ncbi:MAG: hypothetical protein LBG11_08980, partial [Bifidobacteriaceae bacterium]|nr:hypothetical protein [Bifidobacteriaceae bacterium]